MYKLAIDFGYSSTKALQFIGNKTIGSYRVFPSSYEKTSFNSQNRGYYADSLYPHIRIGDELYILGRGKNDVQDKAREALPFILGTIAVSGDYEIVISHYDSKNFDIVENFESLVGVHKFSRNINKSNAKQFAINSTKSTWVDLTVNIRTVRVVQEGIGALAFVYNNYDGAPFPDRPILIVDIGAGTTDLIATNINPDETGYDKYHFEKPVTHHHAVDELIRLTYERVANNNNLLFSDFELTMMRESMETKYYGTGDDAISIGKELEEAKVEWKRRLQQILTAGGYTTKYNLLWTGGGAALLFPEEQRYSTWHEAKVNKGRVVAWKQHPRYANINGMRYLFN